MRRLLDRLYVAAGGLAALAILGICLLVSAQIGLNILARLGGPEWSFTIPSYADFAGYMLAAASFLALAHTLRAGGHIRVTLVTGRLPERARWIAELTTLALGAAMAGYACRFAALLMAESWHYGDKSTGIVAIPIFVPQGFMVAGLGLLTLAFLDTLIESARARRPVLSDRATE
jgi:TRAP-type C4-dicarboxylate transport system permease small subunit